MTINASCDLLSISLLELLAFYIYDNDLLRLVSFEEFGNRVRTQGVKII